MKLGITVLIYIKDDIEFVTEFPCFWDTLYRGVEDLLTQDL